jgi:hypothetical protein
VHGQHGVHFYGTGVEISKQRDEQDVLEIFRMPEEMVHVLDYTADEDYPDKKYRPNDLLNVWLQS